jgi:RimJ/RimL family protein N-acetyltransferase
MVTVVPSLTDGVIVLNGFTGDDIAAHLAGEDEETARRFGWWPQTSTEATVRDAFDRWAQSWETAGPTRTFAARESQTGRQVGGCELRLHPDGPAEVWARQHLADGAAEVSYWTAASHRRRGYATRALILLLHYARSIGVTQVEAHVAEDNQASRRVSEKAGLHLAGTFTDEDGTGMIRYQADLKTSGACQGSTKSASSRIKLSQAQRLAPARRHPGHPSHHDPAGGWPATPLAWPPPWRTSSATPPTGPPAAPGPGAVCLPARWQRRRAAVRPMTGGLHRCPAETRC